MERLVQLSFPPDRVCGRLYLRKTDEESVWDINNSNLIIVADGNGKVRTRKPANDDLVLRVNAQAASDLSFLDALSSAEIDELVIRKGVITRDQIRHLDAVRSLRSLQLYAYGLESKDYAFLSHLPSLRVLYLGESRRFKDAQLLDERVLEHIVNVRQLESLDLSIIPLSEVAATQVRRHGGLRHLSLTGWIDGSFGPALRGTKGLLSLHINPIDKPEHLLADIATLESLRSLHLPNYRNARQDLHLLHSLLELRSLNLSNTSLRPGDLRHLRQQTRLEELYLQNLWCDEDDIATLADLEHLRCLRLDETHGVTPQSMHQIATLPQLRSLGVTISSKVAETSMELAGCTELQRLWLTVLHGSNERIALTGLQLESLEVSSSADISLDWLIDLPNLRVLTLHASGIINGSFNGLAALEQLTELEIASTHIDEKLLSMLNKMQHLRSLRIYGYQLEERLIVGLGELPSLRVLELEESHISVAAMQALANLTNLEHLNCTSIATAAVPLLLRLPKLESLLVQRSVDRFRQDGTLVQATLSSRLIEETRGAERALALVQAAMPNCDR